MARSEFDRGPVAPNLAMHGMTLAIRRTAAQQKDLNQLLAAQQNPASPQYHKWLTPEQFADRFGASSSDVLTLSQWLEGNGFQVKAVARSRNFIRFDGTAAQVNSAFATEMHHYVVKGVEHFANASEPSVPSNLAPLVLGIGGLNDFLPHANHVVAPKGNSQVKAHSLNSGNIYLGPSDLATIYDIGSLQTAASMGAGQTVVVIGTNSITQADLSAYCTANSLSCGTFTYTFPAGDGDPGQGGGVFEATMDLELVSAVAPAANLVLDSDAIAWNALSDAVTNDTGKIILMSYGACESSVGSTLAHTIEGYVQQANSQGQTVIAASGNNGAADCDTGVASATQGLAVDVPASIPEVTGVGGTEFTSQSDFISGVPSGYVPEEGWNDTAAYLAEDNGYPAFAASGGGISSFFAVPAYQTNVSGVLAGGRNVPDVALAASPFTDYYQFLITMGESQQTVYTGGTAAPSAVFAGIVALMNQAQAAHGLGNINTQLYTVAAGSDGSTAFHDITSGNNYVPCTQESTNCPASAPYQIGYAAAAGYDQVTGLGSVDASNLNTAWTSTPPPVVNSITGWATAGNSSPVVLTLNGSELTSAATVKFQMWSTNTASSSLSWASCPAEAATSCTVTVPAVDLTKAGTAYITVTLNHLSSTPQAFTIAPAPVISWVTPHTATAGNTTGIPVTITGSNFASGYTVLWNGTGSPLAATISATSITATVPAADLATAGTDSISVMTPDGVSSSFGFTVAPAPNSTSLNPASAIAGSSSPVLVTITGTGFTPTSVVKWNTTTLTSYYGSATSMVASIPAADLATAGTAQIYVVSADGVSSAGSTFTINAQAVITGLTPNTIPAGPTQALPVVIAGTGFSSTSQVKWNSTTLSSPTYSSANHTLTVSVPTADLATGGSNTISVVNDGVSSVASANSTFTVTPVIASLSPSTAPAGSSQAVNLTITGNGFTTASVVVWKGRNSPLTGSSCSSATSCTATVPASYLATAGLASVQVRTADNVSSVVNNASEFSIASASILSFNPTSYAVGGPDFALTVNGSGFAKGAQIMWWNSLATPPAYVAVTTTFEGSTQLVGTIPGTAIPAAATSVPVAVVNADSTWSAAAKFAIVNPTAPVITTLTPSSAVAGTAAAVVIKGTGFIAGTSTGTGSNKTFTPGSTVLLDGASNGITYTALGTTTQITINIPAASLMTTGSRAITVVSNGLSSAPAPFPVAGPAITSASPTSLAVGAAAPPTVVVTGVNFIAGTSTKSGSTVTFTPGSHVFFSLNGGTATEANYTALGTATSITTTVPVSVLGSSGVLTVTVKNTVSGNSVASAPYSIAVADPEISSLGTTSIPVGSASFALVVSGSNFIGASTVYWGSTALVTTAGKTAGQLSATVPASSLQTAGSFDITVKNGSAGTSAASAFQVLAPNVASLSASSAAADAGFSLTVTGTNFVASSKTVTGSQVSFMSTGNSETVTPLTTVSGTGTTITATVPSTLAAGTYIVFVQNPGLTNGTYANSPSNGTWFYVGTLIPNSAPAGSSSAVPLTVNGTGFTSTSKLSWGSGSNAQSLTTTYVSPTQLTTSVPASYLTTPGTVTVTVSKGTLTGATFTVAAPTITLLSPSSASAADSTVTSMTVTGTNFVSGVSKVYWGSTALTTTFVSSTSLKATITATQLQTPGPVNVTVQNGGSSAASSASVFTVNGPAITSLSSNTAVAGAAGFTLTVTGTSFVAGSTVYWGSTALTTTFVSSTSLTAAVTSAQLLAAGPLNVTVQNGSSSAVSSASVFTVNGPTITNLSSTTAVAGAASFTLTVTGTNFVAGSTVQWDGSALTTSYVNATTLHATVTSAVLTTGTHSVTVQNTSSSTTVTPSSITFTVTAN